MAINMTLPCDHPFRQDWEIDKEIGKGSYGVVYQLSRNDAGESITSAMKWIPLPGDDTEIQHMYAEGLTRTAVREHYEKLKDEFSAEIQLLYQLRGNSHIVSLEDYKIIPREGGNAVGYDIFIRMELLTSLEKWLLKKKTITYRDIVQIGEDLCDALNDCSRLSIIHRDIKPDNIFVTDDNRFKLGDFGIARKLQNNLNASQRVGSLGYMSPEVFHAQTYDHRADLYSLGLVLYKLVNNRREPFSPPAPEIITPQLANKANETRLSGLALPKPAMIPDSLERLWDIIQKACEYEPSNRYETPLEMKKALQSIESLPALDGLLVLYTPEIVTEKDEKKENEENNSPSSSSSAINETRFRTPSSSYDINQTSPRRSISSNKGDRGVTPVKLTDQPEGEKGAPPKSPISLKWIVIALVAGILLIVGILIAIFGGKGQTILSTKWTIKADKVSETSVTLSWTDGPTKEVVCRCFQNEIQIRQEFAVSSPLTISGLTPGREYVFVLASGNESSQISVSTINESFSGQIPLIERVDLFSIKKKYLENTSLARVDGSYFDIISDNVLHLRSGPMSAQVTSQTIWILFSSITNSRTIELVMSIETPDRGVFSRNAVLNLQDSTTAVTHRVALDELLGDVYACYHSWPREDCMLRLYLDGMSVYDTTVRLESGN